MASTPTAFWNFNSNLLRRNTMKTKKQTIARIPGVSKSKKTHKSVESYVNIEDIDKSNPYFDQNMIELTRKVIQSDTISADILDASGDALTLICGEISQRIDSSNSINVIRAYQAGDLLIRLRDLWRGQKVTKKKGKSKKSTFLAFRRMLSENYATKLLEKDKKLISPDLYEIKWEMAESSRRRQLTKYLNIAECGPDILTYSYAGIDAVLEVRYLLLDIHNPTPQEGRPKLDPELARTKLAEVIAKYPYPSLEALEDKDIRPEFRLHTDTVASIYHLMSAGFKESDIDWEPLQEYVGVLKEALWFTSAEELYKELGELPAKEIKDRLSAKLQMKREEQETRNAKPLPEQIADHVPRILDWKKDNPDQKVAEYIGSMPDAKEQFLRIHQYVNELFSLLNPGQG